MTTKTTLKPKRGWAVEIKRPDGTTFRCANENRNRTWAVKHTKALRNYGVKARVVRVLYAEPVVLKS